MLQKNSSIPIQSSNQPLTLLSEVRSVSEADNRYTGDQRRAGPEGLVGWLGVGWGRQGGWGRVPRDYGQEINDCVFPLRDALLGRVRPQPGPFGQYSPLFFSLLLNIACYYFFAESRFAIVCSFRNGKNLFTRIIG